MDTRELLVKTVHELEALDAAKQEATDSLRDKYEQAKLYGFDSGTLKVVIKLRKMSVEQRRERRALETIYLAALGMLEGDPLTDEARRRLDEQEARQPAPEPSENAPTDDKAATPEAKPPAQQALALKDPEEARQEGREAGSTGKRIYDNPYAAGDPCRAAWDEGWCEQKKSHGMETPAAFQRRSKPPEKKDKDNNEKGDA